MKRILFLMLAFLPVVVHATVTNQSTSVSFTCTGSVGPYPFTFPISDPTAMIATQNGTVLLTTAYTIAPVNNNYTNGGSVTLNTACPSGGNLFLLSRVTPLTQTTVFTDNMPVPMKSFERGLDKLTEIVQEQSSSIDGVPFCSGFSPTVGQTVEYSAPLNSIPCWKSATLVTSVIPGFGISVSPGGGTGDVTISSTPTQVCPPSGNCIITGNLNVSGTVTAGTGLLGILNGGRVFADQYCATGTLDQTCINNAFAALPNGGTIVLKPGQIYNVNACTADGDNSWLGGVIINGINGIHVEAYGAKIVLNVNTNNCRAVDIANVQGFKWDGGVITTNYQGVGTLMAIHGGGLHENEVNNTVLGTLQETTWGLPQKSANIGLDNGGTDNGQGIDVQVFTGLRFHGNNQDLIQRGTYMTDQVYIGVKRYDNGITAAATAFEITNGGATFITPFCGVDSGNAVGSTCFKLDAGALEVEVQDFYGEISEDQVPWLIDSSTFYGSHFNGGLVTDLSSEGTSGSPVLWADLSRNQSYSGNGGYILFNSIVFSSLGGGYKAIKLVDSTFGVTMKNMVLPPNITLTNAYLGTNTGWNGDLNGAYATASASGWYLWKPATVQGYQGPAAGYVQTAPAPSGAGYLYQNGSGTYSWASPSAIPIRSGTWSISAATSIPVTFSTAMSVTPTSCSVMPTASSATTGQPFPTTLETTGFTVNVPTSGTIAGTYQCVVNNAN